MKKLIVALVLAVSVSACAGRVSEVYVSGDSAVAAKLLEFKAQKDSRCDAGSIPASSCVAIAKAFVPFMDSYLAVNKLVSAEAPLEQVDAALAEFRAASTELQDVVRSVQGDARKILQDILVELLNRVPRR